ncbi:MAG: DedA family protein [bacterium]
MNQAHSILEFLINYRYVALLPLAILEGPILSLAVGFLAHLGYFNFALALGVMILGDFIPDTAYYFIGYWGDKDVLIRKYDTQSKIVSKSIGHFEKFWTEHPVKTMFISKLAYGLSTFLLITAGIARMSYRKFFTQAFIVTIFQYGTLMVVGYYLGQSYESAAPYVKNTGIIVSAVAVVFLVGYFLLQKYMRNKIINMEE